MMDETFTTALSSEEMCLCTPEIALMKVMCVRP